MTEDKQKHRTTTTITPSTTNDNNDDDDDNGALQHAVGKVKPFIKEKTMMQHSVSLCGFLPLGFITI